MPATHPSSPSKRTFNWAQDAVARYRKVRRIATWTILGVVALIALARAFQPLGGDFGRYHQRQFEIERVVDGESVVLDDGTMVALLGVSAPPTERRAAAAKQYLEARLTGRRVTLTLDAPQSRDSTGRLLAYIHITDTDLLNADIVRDAKAFSDRRIRHTYRMMLDQMENDARTSGRGLWAGLVDADMPAWRVRWLEELAIRRGE